MKKKLYEFVEERVTEDNIQTIILISFAITVFIKMNNINGIKMSDMIDYSVILSIIILFLSKFISVMLSKLIRIICEDPAKLSDNYGELAEKYHLSDLITVFEKSGNTGNDFQLPVELIYVRRKEEEPYDIKLNYSQKDYELPDQIIKISEHLIKAHRESRIYNSRCFRLDKITKIDNEIHMGISRTSYYDSLLTNRAMDYRWPDGRSNRKVYEPELYVSPLEYSKMSNHIGINGIIETIDEKFIFIKRSREQSIGKHTIGTSVGAGIKANHVLDKSDILKKDAILYSITEEINEELGISGLEIERQDIVAIYRNIVEGGKPQVLFYKKLEKEYEFKGKKPDGKRIFIKRDTVMESEFKVDGIIMNKRFYSMMPSVVASIVLIKYHLDDSIPFPLQNTNQDNLTENRE